MHAQKQTSVSAQVTWKRNLFFFFIPPGTRVPISAITNSHIVPDEGSIDETSEFYLQLPAFNLPPSHF